MNNTPTYTIQELEKLIATKKLPEVNIIARIVDQEKHKYTTEEITIIYNLLADRIEELLQKTGKEV